MSLPRRFIATGAAVCASCTPLLAQADFIKDSKGSLEARNFYFSRDFRQDNAPQSQAREWALGFIPGGNRD